MHIWFGWKLAMRYSEICRNSCMHAKQRKLSFESFMKQVTGIGDPSGEFVLPDGTKADVSKVHGVW